MTDVVCASDPLRVTGVRREADPATPVAVRLASTWAVALPRTAS